MMISFITLTEGMKENYEDLKNARCMLLEMGKVTRCDSDAIDFQEGKNHIGLFKKMYTESFHELNH